MSSPFDEDILTSHSFDGDTRKMTQEGTLMSPPILALKNDEDLIVPCVSLDSYNQVIQYYKSKLKEQDREFSKERQEYVDKIDELQRKCQLAAGRNAVTNEKKLYLYDPILFPEKVNGDMVVDALVKLCNLKDGEKWLISNKRCWVIAWRILMSSCFLNKPSKLSDFCRLVNNVVLQHIDDEDRKRKISCDINNFTSIDKEDYPPYMFDPSRWSTNYRKDPKGCKSLKKALQIKKALEFYLDIEK